MKNVEAAAKALEAYSGKELAGANPYEVKEDLQDLLTDLEHFAEAFGCSWPEYEAHLHYLQEAQRCFGCGMTRAEIQTEHDADTAGGMPDVQIMPVGECAGVWDKLGQAGPHVWEEVVARPSRNRFENEDEEEEPDGAPLDLGNETYATDGSAVIEEYMKRQTREGL